MTNCRSMNKLTNVGIQANLSTCPPLFMHTPTNIPHFTQTRDTEKLAATWDTGCMRAQLVHTHSFPSLEGELQALEAGAVLGCVCVVVLGTLPELSFSSVQAVPMARTTRPDSPSRSKHCR